MKKIKRIENDKKKSKSRRQTEDDFIEKVEGRGYENKKQTEKKRRKGNSSLKIDNVYSSEKLVLALPTSRCHDSGY